MSILRIITFYIGLLISCLTFLNCYRILSKKEIKFNKKNLLILIIISTLMLLNNLYNLLGLRLVISYAITFILYKMIFKESSKKTLLCTSYIIIISILIEFILTLLLMFFISDVQSLNDNTIFKFVFTIIEMISIYFIFKLKFIEIFFKKITQTLTKIINYYSFSLLIIIILNIIGYFRAESLQNISYLTSVIMCVLFIVLTINIIINDKYNNLILKEKNEELKNSFKAYSETIDECKILKHNFKNDLLSLTSIVPSAYKKDINSIINKYNRGFDWINKIHEIPEGLQGLFYLKINEAKNKNIKIYLNTKKYINASDKDYIDLCDSITILIDNAIEASKKAKSKLIEINITEDKELLKIKIMNLYKNSIDINKIGDKNYSTKEMKSGLGLNYIKHIKNTKIKVKFNIYNDLFITEILYKQKKST